MRSAGLTPEAAAQQAIDPEKEKCAKGCGGCALRAVQYPDENSSAVAIEIDCPNTSCRAEYGDPLVVMAHSGLVDIAESVGVEVILH